MNANNHNMHCIQYTLLIGVHNMLIYHIIYTFSDHWRQWTTVPGQKAWLAAVEGPPQDGEWLAWLEGCRIYILPIKGACWVDKYLKPPDCKTSDDFNIQTTRTTQAAVWQRSAGHCLVGGAHRNQSLPGPVQLLVCLVGWTATVGYVNHCKPQSGHPSVKYSAHDFDMFWILTERWQVLTQMLIWWLYNILGEIVIISQVCVPKLMTFALEFRSSAWPCHPNLV